MKKIFVGNLSFSVTEAELRSLFEVRFGGERQIRDGSGYGTSEGFGFVEMANDTDADKAISGLNGKDVEGRTLNGRMGEV